MQLHMNYAMDASWMIGEGLGSDSTTPSPLVMNVDYVKVWTSKP